MSYQLIIFLAFATSSTAVWLGEEYWTTVSSDGSLLGDRSVNDFLTFDVKHHNIPITNAYVAFWITYDEFGHYETFGHAYLVQNKICGRFVNRNHKATVICGGFRVLSQSNKDGALRFKFIEAGLANIHLAVEYRNKQVAKILSWQKKEASYGSANMKEAVAEGIEHDHSYNKISYIDDPFHYQQYVYILVTTDTNDAEVGKASLNAFYHTPKEEEQIIHNDKHNDHHFHRDQRQKHRKHDQEYLNRREYERYEHARKHEYKEEQSEDQEDKNEREEQRQDYKQDEGRQRYLSKLQIFEDDEPTEKWHFYQHSRL